MSCAQIPTNAPVKLHGCKAVELHFLDSRLSAEHTSFLRHNRSTAEVHDIPLAVLGLDQRSTAGFLQFEFWFISGCEDWIIRMNFVGTKGVF